MRVIFPCLKLLCGNTSMAGDYNRDPNIQALKGRGFIDHGSTLHHFRGLSHISTITDRKEDSRVPARIVHAQLSARNTHSADSMVFSRFFLTQKLWPHGSVNLMGYL